MKFKCCEYLLNEIVFSLSAVTPCCCSPNPAYEMKFLSNFNGKLFDVNKYIEQRNIYISQFKDNIIPKSCIGCNKVEEKDWNEEPKIKRIIITNSTKCSCNCIYCSLVNIGHQTKKELNTRKAYDIKPVLYDLYKKNLIEENCIITVGGGECAELPQGELDYIIYIASILKCRLEILSSGMFYSKTIENALTTQNCILKISTDSGNKKTFEKIKQVKTFDRTWKNLKNYIQKSKRNKNSQVVIKYIILPGINDNINEAKSFIKKCRSIGCRKIEIAIEYLYFEKIKNNSIPKSIKETLSILLSSNFDISFEGQVQEYVRNNIG